MKLPNYENAIVPDSKITEYLLSETHRDGRHKAAFFQAFGYQKSVWQRLRDDLLLLTKLDVALVEQSPFGTRYIIEGIIQTPDGRTADVRTGWFIESGSDVPRLATSYPARQRP